MDIPAEEGTPGKVIALPGMTPLDDRPPVIPHRREYRDRCHCSRQGTVVDEDAHKLYCATCQRELDPIAQIIDYARAWDQVAEAYKRVQENTDAARTRLESLLRREKNAKSRLRRLPARGRLYALCAELVAPRSAGGRSAYELKPAIAKAVAELDESPTFRQEA